MKLLEQIQSGNLTLKNRMVMSAMSRSRANMLGVVGDLTVQYYTQRIHRIKTQTNYSKK